MSSNPTKIRSILYKNVESILDTVSKIRNSSSESDALFGGEEQKPQLKLQEEVTTLTELEVLLQEKNSLGLYVSGSPLQRYKKLLEYVREVADRNDLHLLLIDKIRKIFTRSNTMMLAVAVTSADEVQYEGIVFPKNAPRISSLLAEKEIFWVKGKIMEAKKRKNDETEEGGYEELPKIAFDEIQPFVQGVNSLFASEEIKLSLNRQKELQSIPYSILLNEPQKLEDFLSGEAILPSGGPQGVMQVKIPSDTPKQLLQRIKALLLTVQAPGTEAVELWIQKSGEYKKVKGTFFANTNNLLTLLDEKTHY